MKYLIHNLRDIAEVLADSDKSLDDVHEAVNDLNELADRLQDEGITDKAKKPKRKKPKK